MFTSRGLLRRNSYGAVDDGDGDAANGGGGGGGGGRGMRQASLSADALGKTRSFRIPLVMPRISALPRRRSSGGLHARLATEEAIWSAEETAKADVATAVSRDLVRKAERWRLLAGDPTQPEDKSQMPVLARGVDKHEVAAVYVKDALAGRDCSAIMHTRKSLRSLRLFRNKAWNTLLNACTIVHLILPMIEVQRCLPCMHLEKLPPSPDVNALFIGWRPTSLGSMWMESIMCMLYATHIRQEALSRLGKVCSRGGEEGEDEKEHEENGYPKRRAEVYSLWTLPPWQLARTCMVTLIGGSLVCNLVSHYALGITWFSWRHAIVPFLFIARRTYLKHFVTATIRLLPRMLPVVFLISFITFFYGFLGYIVYRDDPHVKNLLADLELFDTPETSALTFLRIFTARSFMLDVDKIYGDKGDMEVMVLSYGVIMFIFLLALVPAVATHNFNLQSKKSYYWAMEQRTLSLTRAFMLLKQPDGTLAREDYIQLMACLRPDCDREHTSALFTATKKAEWKQQQQQQQQQSASLAAMVDDRNRLSKAGFFMICALGTADISRSQNQRMKMFRRSRSTGRAWERARRRLNAALTWSRPGSNFPVTQHMLNVALLIQGYQIFRAGDSLEERPTWVWPLGAALLVYFSLQSFLHAIAAGARSYFLEWRNVFETSLNLVGVAYYGGVWPRGGAWNSLYQILQASRLELLWKNMHLLGPTSSEVATRLEFVYPAVIRASFVLFSVTYSFAVVAYVMYCSTPLGAGSIDGLEDNAMVQRFAAVKEVASFATLPESFASMMYVVMFSNWTMFMDAAGVVGNLTTAKIFFYSFKIIGFYFIMPVLLGSSVTAYMNVQVPTVDSAKLAPASTASPPTSTNSTPLSRRPSLNGGGGGGGMPGDDSPKHLRHGTLSRRISFGDDVASRSKDGTRFGYSTLADGPHAEIDVAAFVSSKESEALLNRDSEASGTRGRSAADEGRGDRSGDSGGGGICYDDDDDGDEEYSLDPDRDRDGRRGRERDRPQSKSRSQSQSQSRSQSRSRSKSRSRSQSRSRSKSRSRSRTRFEDRGGAGGAGVGSDRGEDEKAADGEGGGGETDRAADEEGGVDHALDGAPAEELFTEEEGDALVVVASRSRSLSQTFWAQHQTADGGMHASTTMQGALARLEAEIVSLKTENARLRTAMDDRGASARMDVAGMQEEMRASNAGGNSSSTAAATSPRPASVGFGMISTAGQAGRPLSSTSRKVAGSLRNRVISSATVIWGMDAIYETENDDSRRGDGLV